MIACRSSAPSSLRKLGMTVRPFEMIASIAPSGKPATRAPDRSGSALTSLARPGGGVLGHYWTRRRPAGACDDADGGGPGYATRGV